ncbi:MAG: hypothetical protein JSV04_14710 [Candidatus Heimdallarchaeota archaeon]|nr:MAG: hypothetical protein JSV04_14710 [Candidatus Heimdallarchaeota archaeon]
MMIKLNCKKTERISGLWLLGIVGFVIVLTSITTGVAAQTDTTTTILSDVGVAKPGDIIQFTIWVYAGFDPVPTGPIRIIDINTSEYDDSIILGGKACINWTVPESIDEGIHVFEAVFQGYQEFSSSSGICLVNIDDFSPGISIETSITLNINSTVAFKNSSIMFSIELEILGSVQPYFKGGYISVRNTNLSSSPAIHTYGPLPLKISSTLSYSFDYQIPIFSSVGINVYFAEYTGSSQSQTQPCNSSLQNVTIMSTGYWITQSSNQNVLQREESTLELNTTILGDNPIGLKLYSYYYQEDQKVIIENQLLTERSLTTYFSPNSSVSLGILTIITELIDPSPTEFLFATSSQNVTILDRARIDHSVNSTEYRHNQTIRFEVYVTEEDVHTHPVLCGVEFIDVTDDNRSIVNKTTNQDGFVVIDYPIPDNSTVGSHVFSFRTHTTNEYIINVSETFSILIKGLIEIDLTYRSNGVDRNDITIIEVTVLSGGTAISEGSVALEFAINSSSIETQDCKPGLEFHYFIKPSHPVGVSGYQIHYLGSPNYDELIEPFDLTVFSTPIFNITGQNASEVIKGQTVRIWGQLVDEIGQPVVYEEVELTDTTIGMFLDKRITDEQGIFHYDYTISESTQIGVHFIEIAYLGNIFEFYHSSLTQPVIDITVRPPLSVMIEKEVVADTWTNIALEGGLNDQITLEWQKNGQTDWSFLTTVLLNSSGQGYYNWSTPYFKGEFAIRAIGPDSTKYDFSTMYAIPNISIFCDEIGNVNDPHPFTVNITEKYQIWIGSQLWQDWREAGIHHYEYTFSSRGIKEITIVCNESYVYYKEFHLDITIYEELFVTLSAPLESLVNVTVNLDGTVIGEVSGPIQEFDATLFVNDTEFQVDSTNGAGHFYFSLVFKDPGHYSLMVATPLSKTDFYSAAFSIDSIISIKSVPASVQIQSPLNQTYGAIVEVSIVGNADNYWYNIEPEDSMNISWSAPIYRNLAEGSYTCHVFGQNTYGVITHVCTNFTVDITAPSLVLLCPTNSTYTTNEILLFYLTDEDVVTAYLDGIELQDVEVGSVIHVTEGSHNFTLTSQDQVGNNVTQVAFFCIDTVPPSLKIYSPYNQSSYSGEIEVLLGSNGSTILFFIDDFHSYNQTYTEPVSFNLSIGYYILHIYAFDSAGNLNKSVISFSIVQTVELLINPSLEIIDHAGNYLIHTQIISHPNFEKIGILLNGTNYGSLEWSLIHQDYRLSFQLENPGLWELTLFANTTLGEYDFIFFEIEWNPQSPVFESISIYMGSSYEVRVQINTGSLSLDTVMVYVNETFYELTYEYFGDRWVVNLPIYAKNDSLHFFAWYPWDKEPSADFEHPITWFAPRIILEDFVERRENFTLGIRIEKQNASIDTTSVIMIINNGTFEIDIRGILLYESMSGSFQEWAFDSPNLSHELWNYSVSVTDVHNSQNIVNGSFDATDFPPVFKEETVVCIANYTTGELWRVEVVVSDDYAVDRVLLYVDGDIEETTISQNETHFVFEVWLNEGIHSLHLVAYDDINQVTEKILPSIDVSFENTSASITDPSATSSSTTSPLSTTDDSKTGESTKINDQNQLIEIGFAGSIFLGTAAIVNIAKRWRRM